MTTTAWAHLPNARHIDAVLDHAEAHPDRWRDATKESLLLVGDRQDALSAAHDAIQAAGRGEARTDAWGACRVYEWAPCYALIAWDDAGQLMDVPLDAVRTLAAAGHHPAVLLLPARLAMEETP